MTSTLTSFADDTAVAVPPSGDLGRIFLKSWRFLRDNPPVFAYAADDFLRDANGQQLILTFEEAVREVASRNPGQRPYYDPMELRGALEKGRYQDGDWFVAPLIFLNGHNAYGQKIRAEDNVFDRLNEAVFAKIHAEIQSHQRYDAIPLANTCSMSLDMASRASYMLAASFLKNLKFHGFDEPAREAGVIPVCLYRTPLALHPS